jgi:hypothetical protein
MGSTTGSSSDSSNGSTGYGSSDYRAARADRN